jgi:hypothetical protein
MALSERCRSARGDAGMKTRQSAVSVIVVGVEAVVV